MTKQVISIALLATILLQSCVAYQSTSRSINEAKNMGKVKVISTVGNNQSFKNIYLKDSIYFGLRGNQEIRLNPAEISGIYLKDYKKSRTQTNVLVVGLVTAVGIVAIVAVVAGVAAMVEVLPLLVLGGI